MVDLRTVREAAQAYVMLSRVQSLSQLVIIESVCAHKLYASPQAINELDRLTSLALNIEYNNFKCFIVSCNVRSISRNFLSLVSVPKLKHADVVCLQETWLTKNMSEGFELDGFE